MVDAKLAVTCELNCSIFNPYTEIIDWKVNLKPEERYICPDSILLLGITISHEPSSTCPIEPITNAISDKSVGFEEFPNQNQVACPEFTAAVFV
jgi:hypothetical protein